MTAYVVRRLFYMVITLVLVSVVGFAIIQLPPGDFLSSHLRQLGITGTQLTEEELQSIRAYYGLDSPGYMQYFVWVGNLLRGDLGNSYSFQIPVAELVGARLPLTVLVSVLTMVVTFLLAVPDRHLLGHSSILARGLHGYRIRLHRAGHPQLHARPAVDVDFAQLVRFPHHRACSPPNTWINRGAWPSLATCCCTCRSPFWWWPPPGPPV